MEVASLAEVGYFYNELTLTPQCVCCKQCLTSEKMAMMNGTPLLDTAVDELKANQVRLAAWGAHSSDCAYVVREKGGLEGMLSRYCYGMN